MAVSMNSFWDNSGTVIPGGDAEYVVAEQPIAEYDNWFNYNIVADIQAVIDDVINRFNANTILKADTDNTPAALVVAEQTIVGRKTGNSIAALTDTEVRTLINVEDGSTGDQSDAEIRAAVEAATDSNVFTDNDHTKLNGIEAAADVTDSTNVASSGAVMDADFSAAEGFMRKTGAGTYVAIKSNMGAAVAPTANEDSGDGYAIGSRWLDTTADREYVCLDASSAAAVWVETSAAYPSTIIVHPHNPKTDVVGTWTVGTNAYPDLVWGMMAESSNGSTDKVRYTVDVPPGTYRLVSYMYRHDNRGIVEVRIGSTLYDTCDCYGVGNDYDPFISSDIALTSAASYIEILVVGKNVSSSNYYANMAGFVIIRV